jgi:uncharacterized protein (TIGR00266 family)
MAATCPKCGSTRIQGDECLQCGIYLSKYQAHLLAQSTGAGFPPPPHPAGPAGPMDDIKYKVEGEDIQFVDVELAPGQAAVAEPGAMLYVESDVIMETTLGGILSAGARLLSGESLFLTSFTNRSGGTRRVGFAAPFPGKIIALRLADFGGGLLAEKGAFLAAANGVRVTIAFQKSFGAGLLGGAGFILQRLEGSGLVFVSSAGAVYQRQLTHGESLRVQTGSIVAFEQSVSYDIEYVGNIKSALFGGQGLVFAALRGPGRIWLQSPAMANFAKRLAHPSAPATPVSHAASGTGILGGLLHGGSSSDAGTESGGGSILDGIGGFLGGGSDSGGESSSDS